MARVKRDIYGLDQKIGAATRGVLKRDDVSQHNKDLILKFVEYTKFKGKSKQTQYKNLYSLAQLASELKKDFDKLTKDDVKRYLGWLHDSKYADATQQVRKMSLKLLIRWLAREEEERNSIALWSWMDEEVKTTMRAKNESEKMDINKAALLSPEEVLDFAKSVKGGKDRAFIMTLYDTGARIGELLPLSRGDIELQPGGYAVITVTGKTGRREIPVQNCVPDLLRWLRDLPNPDDPKQAVWVVEANNGYGNQYDHRTMKRRLYSLAKRWQPDWSDDKIQSKVHFHNWRHSRATELAKRGWSEYELCLYFGWKIGSKIPSVYIALSGRDLMDRIKRDNGEQVEKPKPPELRTRTCPACGLTQSAVNAACEKCGVPLTLQEFTRRHQKQVDLEKKLDVMNQYIEMMQQQPEGGIELKHIMKAAEKAGFKRKKK